MFSQTYRLLLLSLPLLAPLTTAQSASNGYTGYSLSNTGTPDSAVYGTADTPTNASAATLPPDVYLNASVSVQEIDITVSNLTAKINLQASVLQLLQFNAGIDLSIDRVSLQIQNVSAHVVLEARLENLVLMINDTLNSIDLNPIIATLGQDVGSLVNTTLGGLTGSGSSTGSGSNSTLQSRASYDLSHNILYSINDYSGNTHTNRILTQTGSIVEQSLDNDGVPTGSKTVGSYLAHMSFNGYNLSTVYNGQAVTELEYVYVPFRGISVVSAIFVNAANAVVGTRVLSESSAGGSSTIGDL
ncbi:hypothetical protein MMC19_001805 [Ptychographa xylographoides]|nr:hypothetical protein [Ptychographa xylographoides]